MTFVFKNIYLRYAEQYIEVKPLMLIVSGNARVVILRLFNMNVYAITYKIVLFYILNVFRLNES